MPRGADGILRMGEKRGGCSRGGGFLHRPPGLSVGGLGHGRRVVLNDLPLATNLAVHVGVAGLHLRNKQSLGSSCSSCHDATST